MEYSDDSVKVAHKEFDRCLAISRRSRVPDSMVFGLLSALKLLLMELPMSHKLVDDDCISVCAATPGARSKMKGVHYYLFSSAMELTCIERDGECLYVTDPVTTCMQMAGYTSREETVALFDELTRRHREDRQENEEAFQKFLEDSGGFKGKAAARWALKRHRMGTDSSMESRLRLTLTGARFPEPEVNPVFVDPDSHKVWIPDMAYVRLGMTFEYQGHKWHASTDALDNDSHKSLRLQRFDCKVIPVTFETLSIPWRRDEFLASVRAMRRQRLRFSARRKAVLAALFTLRE